MGLAQLSLVGYAETDRKMKIKRLLRSSASLCWEQPWHPARGKGRWECEAQRRARALGHHYALINECGNDAAGLALSGADNGGRFTARQFTAIKQRFKDVAGLRRELV